MRTYIRTALTSFLLTACAGPQMQQEMAPQIAEQPAKVQSQAAEPTTVAAEAAPVPVPEALPKLTVRHKIKARRGPKALHQLTLQCDATRLQKEQRRLHGRQQAIIGYHYTLLIEADTQVTHDNLSDSVRDCIVERAKGLVDGQDRVEVQFAALLSAK